MPPCVRFSRATTAVTKGEAIPITARRSVTFRLRQQRTARTMDGDAGSALPSRLMSAGDGTAWLVVGVQILGAEAEGTGQASAVTVNGMSGFVRMLPFRRVWQNEPNPAVNPTESSR